MSPTDLVTLRELAHRVRSACESVASSLEGTDEFGYFPEFPEGQCRTASYLLAEFIVDRRPGMPIIIACGWRDGVSHAWIEIGTLVIDITADQEQLGGTQPAVIVLDGSQWHSEFTEIERESFERTTEQDDAMLLRLMATIRPLV